MKKKSLIFIFYIVLIVVAFFSCTILNQKNIENQIDLSLQNEVETHDFSQLIRFKTSKLSCSAGVSDIYDNLPLLDIKKKYSLNNKNGTIKIDFLDTTYSIDNDRIKTSIVYDSFAIFALVNNIETITYNFKDASYNLKRKDFSNYYDFSSKINIDAWNKNVRNKVLDISFVDSLILNN